MLSGSKNIPDDAQAENSILCKDEIEIENESNATILLYNK